MSTPKPARKAPKARVMYIDPLSAIYDKHETLNKTKTVHHDEPVVILPFPTAAQARAFCKVANKSHEEKVRIVADAFAEMQGEPQEWRSYLVDARMALARLHFPSGLEWEK